MIENVPKGFLTLLVVAFLVIAGLLFVANKQMSKQNTNKTTSSTQTLSNFVSPTQKPPLTNTPPTPGITFDPNIATYTAVMKTSKGDITLQLFHNIAPKTVETFITKAKSGFYNGLTFHRVEDWVAQGGDPLGNGTGGGNEPVEFNNRPFGVGALGQASRGDGKVQNDSQFFITKKDSEFLNGQYTNYGQVTAGMDVVNKLQIGDKILGITIE